MRAGLTATSAALGVHVGGAGVHARRAALHALHASLALCVALSVVSCRRSDLVVNTDKGKVRGARYYLPSLGMAVDAFLGIPFAKPPVQHLRFRHPQPIERWNGIYKATKLPNSCYQSKDEQFGDFAGAVMWNANTKVSEDCLYLNVWVPKKEPRLRKSAVMVWIFGGGFYSGTTTLSLYDGKILAATNNIIVVSIGYRVGPFGFLTLNHPGAPGNAGLFDQLMGMEWVQQNIRNFGGNPHNVTLFGESAGSVSVSLHLLSPLSRTKFARAIMQSGTANMPWGTLTMDAAVRRAHDLVFEYLHHPPTDDMGEVVAFLRDLPPQKLADEQWVSRGLMQFPFLPVIDGTFLVEAPDMTLKRNAFKKCPITIGSNRNEGSYFLIYELTKLLRLTRSTMSHDQFVDSIHKLFNHYPQYPQQINKFGLDAITFQYSNWENVEDTFANLNALDDAVAECHFVCHVNEFAYRYALSGEHVYMYYFTQRYSTNPWPKWMGVLHADEIMFVFGEALKPGLNYTADEKKLSREIMRYWTNFAKTGDPNRAPAERSLTHWPRHTVQGRQYLELHTRFLHHSDRARAVASGPRTHQCAFWKHYLPSLVVSTAQLELPLPRPPTQFVMQNATCAGGTRTTCGAVHTFAFALLVLLPPASF